MSLAPFDPRDQIHFDLGRGRITLDSASARVTVPPEALVALCHQAGEEATRDFGHKMGTEVGRRLGGRLGDGGADASLATVVDHLGGEIALLGLGSLSAERWGAVLVLKITESPFAASGDALLAAVIEGALQRAFSRDVRAVVGERDDGSLRLLLVSRPAAETIRGWIDSGTSLGDVLIKLHAASAAG